MKTPIVTLETLCSICGYFTSKTDINGGYGCTHLDNEDEEQMCRGGDGYTFYPNEYDKANCSMGKCNGYCCPLANECDVQDLKENESDFLSGYEDEPDDYPCDEIMRVDKVDETNYKELFKKLREE